MSALDAFRKISIVEGISAILLYFVAMPLKYIAHIPEAVRVVGTLHGLLFLVFLICLIRVWMADKWPLSKVILGFIAGNVPFGALWFERRLRADDK